MSSRLLIDEAPLLVIPGLAKVVGLNEAIVLQQVHYWLNPKCNKYHIDDRYWVRKTYKQWGEEFSFWGDKTIRRTIEQLERKGIVITFMQTAHFKKIKYYSIDYNLLNRMMSETKGRKISSNVDTIPKTKENRGSHRDGQNDQIDLPVWANAEKQGVSEPSCGEELADNNSVLCKMNPDMVLKDASSSPEEGIASLSSLPEKLPSSIHPSESLENCGSHRYGQNDHIDLPVWANRCGQSDQMHLVNLGKSYIEGKTTLEKITLPLLSPSAEIREEEEELSSKKVFVLGESMISIWNKTIQSGLNNLPILATQSIFSKLANLLEEQFGDDLAQWKSYCDQIAGCKFLMTRQESGFQVNFFWATKPENIMKVLSGAYYDKPTEKKEPLSKDLPWDEYVSNLKTHCAKQHPSEKWFEICKYLSKKIGQSCFDSWLSEMIPQKLEEDEVILAYPSQGKAERVWAKENSWIRVALESVFPNLKRYHVTYDPNLKEGGFHAN